MSNYDLIVIGGGIAGMTAALVALKDGVNKVLILERQKNIGGTINQCIHNGFGKRLLGAELTGPEYANIIAKRLLEYPIDIKVNTEVIEITKNKKVYYVNSKEGVIEVQAKAIIMATGCREKHIGSTIPLDKVTGIYTLVSAHKIINGEGYLPGKESVIVANNKWAAIVARRLVIEGGRVKALIVEENEDFKIDNEFLEILEGFKIPIILNGKIVDIFGDNRVEGVKILVDEKYTIEACDSLILSVGYFPEIDLLKKIGGCLDRNTQELTTDKFMTSIDGIFACGNLLYGVDALSKKDVDGIDSGMAVAKFLREQN